MMFSLEILLLDSVAYISVMLINLINMYRTRRDFPGIGIKPFIIGGYFF